MIPVASVDTVALGALLRWAARWRISFRYAAVGGRFRVWAAPRQVWRVRLLCALAVGRSRLIRAGRIVRYYLIRVRG